MALSRLDRVNNNFINYYVLSDWQILEFFETLIKMPCHAYYERVHIRSKAKLQKEGIFFLIHLFARDILLMKKLEIEDTKTT